MVTTSPDNLWSPDLGTGFVPTTDLAHTQDTVQAALLARPSNYQVGTNAQRLALTGAQLFDGLRFRTTDTDRDWLYDGALWIAADPGSYLVRPTSVTGGTINPDGTISITSGATSLQVNGVFTTRFRRYVVTGNIINPSNGYGAMQMSTSGTPTAGSAYGYQDVTLNGSGSVASFNNAAANYPISRNLGTEQQVKVELMNPAHPVRTLASWDVGTYVAGKTMGSGFLATTSAYDGFSITSPGAPSLSGGNFSVYGMV